MLKSISKFLLKSCDCLFICSSIAILCLFFSEVRLTPELFNLIIGSFFWSASISVLIADYQASQRSSNTEFVVDLEKGQSPPALVLAKPAILQTRKYKPLREVKVEEEVQEEKRIGLNPSPLTDKNRVSV